MKCISLILFIYYINSIFIFIWCSLIVEFLLPPSNILPHTYRDLSSIMKEIGMNYEAIHACPDDHVIYYNQHEFAIDCMECHISRYRTYQVTKKVSHKVLHCIPMIPCLQWLFRCKKHSTIYRLPCKELNSRWHSLIACRWFCI